MSSIFDKLVPIVQRYEEIEDSLGQPEVAVDFERVQTLARERAGLEDLVDISREYKQLTEDQGDLRSLVQEGGDPELVQMAREELEGVDSRLDGLAQALRLALLPKTPTMIGMSSSKSAPAQGAKKPAFSPATCTACMPGTPNSNTGRLRSWTPTRRTWAVSTRLFLKSRVRAPSAV